MDHANVPQASPSAEKPASTRRSRSRSAVYIRCEARQGLSPWVWLSLKDLSAEGFRMTGLAHPDPSQLVRVRIPGYQVLSAKISWIEKRTIGCAFQTPLHEAVLAHIVAGHAD